MNETQDMIRYLGDGSAYVEGIPARDLTRDEWNGIRPSLRALAVATGLYQVVGETNAAPRSETVVLDLEDGVSDTEATAAARALNARRKEKGA